MKERTRIKPKWLLGFILLVSGGISIILGSGFLTLFLTGSILIGVVMVVTGIGLWMEKEWALNAAFWGFALNIASGAWTLVGMIIPHLDDDDFWLYWSNWIAVVMVVLSTIGFVYLLVVRKELRKEIGTNN